MLNVQAHILSKAQEEAGYHISEDTDFVYLYCKDELKDELVGTYSAVGVTIQHLRQDADTHANGIRFAKV